MNPDYKFSWEKYQTDPTQQVFLAIHYPEINHYAYNIYKIRGTIECEADSLRLENLPEIVHPPYISIYGDIFNEENEKRGFLFFDPYMEYYRTEIDECGNYAEMFLFDGCGYVICRSLGCKQISFQRVVYPKRQDPESQLEDLYIRPVFLEDFMVQGEPGEKIMYSQLSEMLASYYYISTEEFYTQLAQHSWMSKRKLPYKSMMTNMTIPFSLSKYKEDPKKDLYFLLVDPSFGNDYGFRMKGESLTIQNDETVTIKLPDNLYYYSGSMIVNPIGEVINYEDVIIGRIVYENPLVPIPDFNSIQNYFISSLRNVMLNIYTRWKEVMEIQYFNEYAKEMEECFSKISNAVFLKAYINPFGFTFKLLEETYRFTVVEVDKSYMVNVEITHE